MWKYIGTNTGAEMHTHMPRPQISTSKFVGYLERGRGAVPSTRGYTNLHLAGKGDRVSRAVRILSCFAIVTEFHENIACVVCASLERLVIRIMPTGLVGENKQCRDPE